MTEEPRKPFGGWTEEDVEALVTKVSDRVIRDFYEQMGRSVMKRGLQLAGMAIAAILIWLAGGKFKLWGP
jgi:hypothetical protein